MNRQVMLLFQEGDEEGAELFLDEVIHVGGRHIARALRALLSASIENEKRNNG